MKLKLCGREDLVDDAQRDDTLAHVHGVRAEVPLQLPRICEVDPVPLVKARRSTSEAISRAQAEVRRRVLSEFKTEFGRLGRQKLFKDEVEAVVEDHEAVRLNQLLHVAFSDVSTSRERHVEQLEQHEVNVRVLGVLNKLEPVRNGFHLGDRVEVLSIEHAHRHHDHPLLPLVLARHELHQQLVPEDLWFSHVHGKSGLLSVGTPV